MLDAHVHIDHFPDPYEVAREAEEAGITTVAVTCVPSHFEYAYPHVRNMRHVYLAVGLHPHYTSDFDKEFPVFAKRLPQTDYVGEVGLDFSRKGLKTKDQQIDGFRFVLQTIGDGPKILTVHSRMAEVAVLRELEESPLMHMVFHWYTGPLGLVDDIVARGGYFSVNKAMLATGRGRKTLRRIPRDRLLTETDGPFTKLDGRPARPTDIGDTLKDLASFLQDTPSALESEIDANWERVLAYVKSSNASGSN